MTPIVEDVAAWDAYCSAAMSINDVRMSPNMFSYGIDGAQRVTGVGPFTPLHEVYPTPEYDTIGNVTIINYDSSSDPYVNETTTLASNLDLLVLSRVLPLHLMRDAYPDLIDGTEPLSMLVEPIRSSFDEESEIVGYVQSIFKWKSFFAKFGGDGKAVYCSIETSCGDSFTYLIGDNAVTYITSENGIDGQMNEFSTSAVIGLDLDDITLEEANEVGICIYSLTVYPDIKFRQEYNLHASVYAAVVGLTMCIMVGSFFAYDHFVRRRNDKMIKSAVQSTAIVTSMFPSNVRDRLYREQEEKESRRKKRRNFKKYLREESVELKIDNSKPLADFFTESTILFADIAGFTAWSSVREPYQVFTLLETLYAAFDAVAKRRRIFKVETIGDCYVAVSGVPEPRADHAISMCRFANDILIAMRRLTKQMEMTLGPETGDLALRVGLHSGPVTAGVLRGERARFQLFGDTMNTAARMEQTGMKNRIQISQSTADYLQAEGRSNWIKLREDKVVAKGKGELTTFWLEINSESSGGDKSACDSERDTEHPNVDQESMILQVTAKKLITEKTDRLIDWNTEVLRRLLHQIIANRRTTSAPSKEEIWDADEPSKIGVTKPFDEVEEIIALPQSTNFRKCEDETTISVSSEVVSELRLYISCIAQKYNDNKFHNFEHASHVAMGVTKLFSRIVAPKDVFGTTGDRIDKGVAPISHDHTYGIASDPLTQFACVFSALIHDVDHTGVPNSQLINENTELSKRYGKSVAEQNSIDLAWELLMRKEYSELRSAICATKSDFVRFRQLVVNVVMATDIMDNDLKNIRNVRWANAFATDEEMDAEQGNVRQEVILKQVNRKATGVIEHIIQASDVSHTMQHWHIYRKWNEFFFLECYDAFQKGRSMADPSDGWYQGELNFFDFYIIPLAKKLKECGVFGSAGAEYLQYATNNRSEWQTQGIEIVVEMKKMATAKSEGNFASDENDRSTLYDC